MPMHIFKKVMNSLVLALFFVLLAQPAFSQNNQPEGKLMSKIAPAQAAEIIERHHDDPRFFILDVRTLAEYEQGHIAGAKLMDSANPALEQELAKLERNAMYIVYCRSGRRSAQVVEKMQNLGFFSVYDLENGLAQWSKEGFALEK